MEYGDKNKTKRGEVRVYKGQGMNKTGIKKLAVVAGIALLVAGCGENGGTSFLKAGADPATGDAARSSSTKLIERDVEAPDAFQVTESGLWDGRPSLGGVWVAYPDVEDPERVIIRNEANGKFVIGALFRRERDNPGPKLQVSSDAAAALGLLAGQPVTLNVTALRREEVPIAAPAPTPTLPETEEIAEAKLDPIAGAAAAITAAEAKQAGAAPAPAKPVAPAPKKPVSTSKLAKPFIQLGIFSVEANANGTADLMRKSGIVPNVMKQTSSGKTFWRVVVGPASNKAEADALLKTVRAKGFSDAYFVTN